MRVVAGHAAVAVLPVKCRQREEVSFPARVERCKREAGFLQSAQAVLGLFALARECALLYDPVVQRRFFAKGCLPGTVLGPVFEQLGQLCIPDFVRIEELPLESEFVQPAPFVGVHLLASAALGANPLAERFVFGRGHMAMAVLVVERAQTHEHFLPPIGRRVPVKTDLVQPSAPVFAELIPVAAQVARPG